MFGLQKSMTVLLLAFTVVWPFSHAFSHELSWTGPCGKELGVASDQVQIIPQLNLQMRPQSQLTALLQPHERP